MTAASVNVMPLLKSVMLHVCICRPNVDKFLKYTEPSTLVIHIA